VHYTVCHGGSLLKVHKLRYFTAKGKSISELHIFVSAVHCSCQHSKAFRVCARLISQLIFISTLLIYYMAKVSSSWAGHRWQYGARALPARYLRLQMHVLKLCNTHCFSIATTVARVRLNVTLDVHCLSCSSLTSKDYIQLCANCSYVS